MKRQWWIAVLVTAALASPVALLYCPWMLGFPFRTQIRDTTVYSEQPITLTVERQLARADALVAASEFGNTPLRRNLYLTEGDWRWQLLALQSSRAFGFRRAFSNSIVLNATDNAVGTVSNRRSPGGQRSIAGVVAHETTHLATARRYGEVQFWTFPKWKREGYADYVAQESSLSDTDAATLRESHPNDIALTYYDYRHRVQAFLAVPGNTADDLFEVHRRASAN